MKPTYLATLKPMKSTPSLLTLNFGFFVSFAIGRAISSHNIPILHAHTFLPKKLASLHFVYLNPIPLSIYVSGFSLTNSASMSTFFFFSFLFLTCSQHPIVWHSHWAFRASFTTRDSELDLKPFEGRELSLYFTCDRLLTHN